LKNSPVKAYSYISFSCNNRNKISSVFILLIDFFRGTLTVNHIFTINNILPMTKTNPQVDIYISNTKRWQDEMEKLRRIVLSCGLDEKLKWNKPCYTFEDGIVVMIAGMRDSCALSFFK
jgi:hypothetical protein